MNDLKGFLRENPDYVDILERIVSYEKDNKKPDHSFIEDTEHDSFWEYDDVNCHPTRLHQLSVNGVTEKVFDSNSTTAYSLKDREKVVSIINEIDSESGAIIVDNKFPQEDGIPDGIFSSVVGYDDVKFIFERAISSDKITNILMVGPPASGKTVFLRCIRNYLDKTATVNGNDTKSAGFIDMLFREKPKYVLYDELDDASKDEQRSMSQYMEDGIVSETKYDKDREMEIVTKTFATANSTDPLLDNIKDRFLILEFEKYNKGEFIQVCKNILPKDEDKTERESEKIARAIWNSEGEGDVRKAIQVARLSKGDPERVLSVVDDYSSKSNFAL